MDAIYGRMYSLWTTPTDEDLVFVNGDGQVVTPSTKMFVKWVEYDPDGRPRKYKCAGCGTTLDRNWLVCYSYGLGLCKMFTAFNNIPMELIVPYFAQASRRQQMMYEEHHMRMRDLRANQAMMSGYEEVETDPSVAPAAQREVSRKVKFSMPRIPEAELQGLPTYEELSDSSKAIAKQFMDGVLMSDPNADPSKLTEVLVESNASPGLKRLLTDTLAQCKKIVKNDAATST